jgi:hypothetical protein
MTVFAYRPLRLQAFSERLLLPLVAKLVAAVVAVSQRTAAPADRFGKSIVCNMMCCCICVGSTVVKWKRMSPGDETTIVTKHKCRTQLSPASSRELAATHIHTATQS